MSNSSVKMFHIPPTIGRIPDGRRLTWYLRAPSVNERLEHGEDFYPMFPSSLPDPHWVINRSVMAIVPSWMILI